MFFAVKVLISFVGILIIDSFFSRSAWAWGPAIHTVISCSILDNARLILPDIAAVIQKFSLQYMYGNLAADFFIGKGVKKKKGHSHNWETGLKLLSEAGGEKEAAYAYGFLSHLAADVVAHNYFVPDLIHRFLLWKRISHVYTEAVADKFVGQFYLRVARDLLETDQPDCHRMLKSALISNSGGLSVRRHIFTQSVKMTDYIYCHPQLSFVYECSPEKISREYMIFMIGLSYRLVKDLLSHPDSSACLVHDPIGADNLKIAAKKSMISKIFNPDLEKSRFPVAEELLKL